MPQDNTPEWKPERCTVAQRFPGLQLEECTNLIPKGFHKFCPTCSREASKLWRRFERLPGGSYRQERRDRDKTKAAAHSRSYRKRKRMAALDAASARSEGR